MPHTEQCREAVARAVEQGFLESGDGFCAGAGCTFTKEDSPALYEALGGPLLDAQQRLRAWVERHVSDWYDPVIEPEVHDDLRTVLGMEPYDREE